MIIDAATRPVGLSLYRELGVGSMWSHSPFLNLRTVSRSGAAQTTILIDDRLRRHSRTQTIHRRVIASKLHTRAEARNDAGRTIAGLRAAIAVVSAHTNTTSSE